MEPDIGRLVGTAWPLPMRNGQALPTPEAQMAWNTPRIVEITVGAEINSYVSATLR
jgi:coenzyme PQQ precursor peptide PqqA